MGLPAPQPTAPAVVLDTNAVLDWLVFRHPSCVAWRDWLEAGSVRWLSSKSMRDELSHVLSRGVASAWAPDLPALWSSWDRYATAAEPRALAGPATRMRCTDPDDQKFVDLALAHGARWLVSRDKALLKLNRRVQSLGLRVVTPEQWSPAQWSPALTPR
jgi:uncharacterized protein